MDVHAGLAATCGWSCCRSPVWLRRLSRARDSRAPAC